MAVVVRKENVEKFIAAANAENLNAVVVATVTDTNRMVMKWRGKVIVDIDRSFIDTAGAPHEAVAEIESPASPEKSPLVRPLESVEKVLGEEPDASAVRKAWIENMSDLACCSQRGLGERFDGSIGSSSVLMPYGGALQATETQVSVQKLPADGYTDTASMMAFGYDPFLTTWSPYHGAAYAVVDACAKVVAAGGDWSHLRFSYQEYFERMTADPRSWGKPLSALLGALKMQLALGLPSIGGKDSMSGTFEHISVPPTLIAFGVTTVDAGRVISPELKWEGNKLYLIRHTPLPNRMPDTAQLKENWDYVHAQIAAGNIVSAWALGRGGVAEGLAKMAFGNLFGINIQADERTLFDLGYGSVLVESEGPLDFPQAVLLGEVTDGEDGLPPCGVGALRHGISVGGPAGDEADGVEEPGLAGARLARNNDKTLRKFDIQSVYQYVVPDMEAMQHRLPGLPGNRARRPRIRKWLRGPASAGAHSTWRFQSAPCSRRLRPWCPARRGNPPASWPVPSSLPGRSGWRAWRG